MKMLDKIPPERRREIAAELQAELRERHAAADDDFERAAAVTLLEALAPELEDDTYHDHTYRDALGAIPVDSSHPDWVSPLDERS